MRIGIFTFRIRDNPTGLANYARSLSYALAKLNGGMEVVLLNPHPESGLQWYRDFETFPLRSLSEPSSASYILATAPFKLRSAANRLRLDVLHAPGNVAPFVGWRFAAARVATVHDVAPLVLPSEHRLIAKAGNWAGIPPLRWMADALITGSSSSADELVKYGHLPRSAIRIVPDGTEIVGPSDLERLRGSATDAATRLGATGQYFLAVGDVRPRKNLVRVIRAFARLRDIHPNVQLMVVGQEMHRGDAIMQAAHGVDGIVRPGYVSEQDLSSLYAGAVALVFPSLHEGFGLPILEAMARGAPVITSNISSMPEVAGDAAVLIDPLDVRAIERAMAHVLEDEPFAADLRRRGLERAGHFTWESTAKKTVDVYTEAVAKRLRRRK